ncbi:MAG TPA: hypothetical protein PLP53_04640, partial [Plasticicumulans sp.]|nr:hypothetical protein [Plasticicumulans sp.]
MTFASPRMSGVVMPDRSRRQPFWFSGGIGRASTRKSIRPPTLADVGGLMGGGAAESGVRGTGAAGQRSAAGISRNQPES